MYNAPNAHYSELRRGLLMMFFLIFHISPKIRLAFLMVVILDRNQGNQGACIQNETLHPWIK